jgi:CheY-like chemotaxis protein
MNYQDIPFYIWSREQEDSKKIARIFGRQLNTYVESGEQKSIQEFIENTHYFICFIFHLRKHLDEVSGFIQACKKSCPLCPVILYSDSPVSYDIYQTAIRQGVEDILVFTHESDQINLRKLVLSILNRKWKAHRQLEKATKKVYDATVVTAHHEINQPLTVIMNAMTVIKIEIKKYGSDAGQIEKYIGMVIKSLGKIQNILSRFKNVDDPQLKEYTKGVPMVHLQDQQEDEGKIIKTDNRPSILVVESNEKFQEHLANSLRIAGYHAIFISNGFEAIRLTRTMIHKISAVLININISRVEIDELKFELKVQNKNIPIIFHSSDKKKSRIAEVTESGMYKFLLLPFSKDELANAISQSNNSLF